MIQNKINSLGIMRGIMSLCVVLAHANLLVSSKLFSGFFIQGWCGADFFFVFSGFLILWTFQESTPPLDFIKKRFVRILPMYWIYSFFVLALHFLGKGFGKGFINWSIMDAGAILKSFFCIPTDLMENEMPIIPTGWTLAYEIFFYIVCLTLFIYGRKVFAGIVAIWTILIAVGCVLQPPNLTLFMVDPLFTEFFMGMIAAYIVQSKKQNTKHGKFSLLAGSVWLIYSWIAEFLELPFAVNISRVVKFGLPFALILFGLVVLETNNVLKLNLKSNNVFVFLEKISYSLYLVHYPIIVISHDRFLDLPLPPVIEFIFVFALCLLAGAMAYFFLERPITDFLKQELLGYRKKAFSKREHHSKGKMAISFLAVVALILSVIDFPTSSETEFWNGTTGNFVGDSITAQGYYCWSLSSTYNITVNNYGVAGSAISNCVTKIPPMYKRVENMSNKCDFVFVLGGTNDWGTNAVIGDPKDKTEDTFYGGCDLLFSALRRKFPDKPIFVSTILQRDWNPTEQYPQPAGIDSNGNGDSIKDFNQALISVADRYGCVIFDGYGESGITEDNILLYTDDGVHLNEKGGRKFAKFIKENLEKGYPYK